MRAYRVKSLFCKKNPYNSRVGRWLSYDPEGQFDSPYVGMGNDPVSEMDPDGGFSFEALWQGIQGPTKEAAKAVAGHVDLAEVTVRGVVEGGRFVAQPIMSQLLLSSIMRFYELLSF